MTKQKSLGMFLCALMLVSASALAEEPQSLESQVDDVFAEYDTTQGPGCALGVIRDGEMIYARGYGMASLDHGVPIGPESVFRIASTSKQFTAFSIQLLVDSGRVDLDADVRTYLPELPEYPETVTVRHLVLHTSGYRDYLAIQWLAGKRNDDFYTDAEILDLLSRQQELNFPPGSRYLYSNSGYFLLSEIVSRVTGKSLREFAAEEIFTPLEMRHTHFHNDHREVVPRRAVGYSPLDEGGFEIDQSTLEMIGDGGVFTTVEDLARWDANFYEPRVGTAATLERVLQQGVLTNGETIDYASGLSVGTYRGLRLVSHGGSWVGYRAQFFRFPEQRTSVICLCNRSDASPTRLARRVADVYLAEHFEDQEESGAEEAEEPPLVEVSADVLEGFAGAYRRQGRLSVMSVVLEEGGLVAAFSESSRYAIRPIGGDRFFGRGRRSTFEVQFSEEGMTVYSGRNRDESEYQRVELVEPSETAVAALAGDYRCDELASTVRLTAEAKTLRLAHDNPHKNAPDEPFVPTVADTFESDGLVLEVDRSSAGTVERIRLGVGRVRNILCEPAG